jgi:hypothetical protein
MESRCAINVSIGNNKGREREWQTAECGNKKHETRINRSRIPFNDSTTTTQLGAGFKFKLSLDLASCLGANNKAERRKILSL